MDILALYIAGDPLGNVHGHAFASTWLKAVVLQYINTYASRYMLPVKKHQTSLNREKAEVASNHSSAITFYSQTYSQMYCIGYNHALLMQSFGNTKLLGFHSEGKMSARTWLYLMHYLTSCITIHFHTLAHSIHPCCTLEKESSTLNVS